MNPNRIKRNDKLAQRVIKGLNARNIEGYYAANKEEALTKALEIIPEGSSITWGGSMSIEEIGLKEAVLSGNYVIYNRDAARDAREKREIELKAFGADYFLASTNAMTEDGILVNIDGNANRVACLAYGPLHVLMIVGMNKITKDLDAAISRARGEAAPINAQRFDLGTPCNTTGACANCNMPGTICNQILVTRRSMHDGRMIVILVDDNLGF